ncbi:MAG: type III polyketide synthase [Planctomycetes bacterium]|nr:type III polyketide synthase [Planctomycetota bacterium]
MSFAIHGLGTAHPPDAVSADDGLALARVLAGPDVRTSTWLGPIYANSGVAARFQVIGGPVVRDILAGTTTSGSPFLPTPANDGVGPTTAERMALYAAEAGPLAVRASAAALAEAGFAPDSITHVVTVSCTGFFAPGLDFALVAGLGLRPTVARTHVGFMGCHGALNGLRVANAFATADPTARVLVCAAELCSPHYYYGSAADKLVANAIFADGAAAMVGKAARGAASGWELRASGSCLIPDSRDEMAWTVGNHGFEMTLSRRVPGLIAAHLRPWLEGWLSDNGLSLADVASWAVHPGGPKIVTAAQEALALSDEALAPSRAVFAEYGNMSSPTVLFVLKRLREQSASRPCVALGFGPGLVAEAALFV